MNSNTKTILIIVNGIALICAGAWWFYKPDYEPIITTLVLVATIIGLFIKKVNDEKNDVLSVEQEVKTEVNITNNINGSNDENSTDEGRPVVELEKRKDLAKILFVDDDTKFKIIKILNKIGWKTRIIKDVENMDADPVLSSHILFVDIHGVGIKLGFKDEGLGLAHSLKKKYPEKKVVIYSTESTGDRFHEALRSVDSFLSKNAEPFEFQELIEQLSEDINF